MEKEKSYEEYKAEQKARHDSIMEKYGAPEGAKPPLDKSYNPRTHDAQFRAMAFTKKRSLEQWVAPSNRRGE